MWMWKIRTLDRVLLSYGSEDKTRSITFIWNWIRFKKKKNKLLFDLKKKRIRQHSAEQIIIRLFLIQWKNPTIVFKIVRQTYFIWSVFNWILKTLNIHENILIVDTIYFHFCFSLNFILIVDNAIAKKKKKITRYSSRVHLSSRRTLFSNVYIIYIKIYFTY